MCVWIGYILPPKRDPITGVALCVDWNSLGGYILPPKRDPITDVGLCVDWNIIGNGPAIVVL